MKTTGKKIEIVIADDDPQWRAFTRSVLAPEYRVHEASCAAGAVEMARRIRPALIIMDVVMPGGQDGFMALCELQRYPATRFIPVIVFSEINSVSGMQFTGAELEAHLGIAPAAFVEKPASPGLLLREVKRVLRSTDAE